MYARQDVLRNTYLMIELMSFMLRFSPVQSIVYLRDRLYAPAGQPSVRYNDTADAWGGTLPL